MPAFYFCRLSPIYPLAAIKISRSKINKTNLYWVFESQAISHQQKNTAVARLLYLNSRSWPACPHCGIYGATILAKLYGTLLYGAIVLLNFMSLFARFFCRCCLPHAFYVDQNRVLSSLQKFWHVLWNTILIFLVYNFLVYLF